MIKGVIFDMDDTTIVAKDIWRKNRSEFLGKRDLEDLPRDVRKWLSGKSIIEGVTIMQDYYEGRLVGDPSELAQERLDISRRLYYEAEMIDGVESFIKSLKDSGIKVALATAAHRELLAIVSEKHNFEDLFDGHLYCIGDVENKSKPDPAVFLHAAEQIGVEPLSCMVLEDSPLGVQAGVNAEMLVVGIGGHYPDEVLYENGATTVVHDYYEFAKFFEANRENLIELLNPGIK